MKNLSVFLMSADLVPECFNKSYVYMKISNLSLGFSKLLEMRLLWISKSLKISKILKVGHTQIFIIRNLGRASILKVS